MTPLSVFTRTNFDWTLSLTGVWRDLPYDVAHLHAPAMDHILEVVRHLEDDEEAPNPLGAVIVGEAGAGKTHFLSQLRSRVVEAGGTFLLADLTDVRNFWETTLQGAVTSLTHKLPSGPTQLERILDALLARFGEGLLRGTTAAQLGQLRPPALTNRVDELIHSIARRTDRHAVARHEPVLRALILLGSDEQSLLHLGEAWMTGLDVREEAMHYHDLPSSDYSAKDRLAGLAWASQFWGPTVIAVDQLDAITSEARASEGVEESRSRGVFTQAMNGLMGLRDVMPRTVVVVSSLLANWRYIEENALASVKDRFADPLLLRPPSGATLSSLVEQRLGVAYAKAGFRPAYPTYPFLSSCFEQERLTPRQLLRRAEIHRLRCRDRGRLEEIARLPEIGTGTGGNVGQLGHLDEDYASRRARVDPEARLRGADRELDVLLETACRALSRENPTAESLDIELDLDFGRFGRVEPLHARIRTVDRRDGDRERHLSMRFVQQNNAIAFQTRVKKAITESGVDSNLDFRRLVILRSGEIPTGPKSKAVLHEFKNLGGYYARPTHDEIRSLAALTQMFESPPEGFDRWLEKRQPVSHLPVFAPHIRFLFQDARGGTAITGLGGTGASGSQGAEETEGTKSGKTGTSGSTGPDETGGQRSGTAGIGATTGSVGKTANTSGTGSTETTRKKEGNGSSDGTGGSSPSILQQDLPLGRLAGGLGTGETVSLPPSDLRRHVVIMGAAGSGKTVLLKRIIEEAALRGIPAVLIDVANDLSRLDERWPTTPDVFGVEDTQAATRYFNGVEVVVWTPGRETGNPLSADPLPNFALVSDDPDELGQAQQMTVELLAVDLGLKGAAAQIRTALLTEAVRAYAAHGGKEISDLQRILDEPGDIGANFGSGAQQMKKLADQLRAARTTNPLLEASGPRLDLDTLYGRRGGAKTRISVINLSGLPSLEHMQAFVGRLTTVLFTYARANPAREGKMAGLFVLDEAKDFAPSQRQVASSGPLRRAAAQLRKYGYGMILATQEPKSIENQIVANCSTQIFGRALAPTVQQAMREMMQQLGGAPGQVGTLKPGEFYASVPGNSQPRKVKTPLCLSFHGAAPSPEDVRTKARRHHARLSR